MYLWSQVALWCVTLPCIYVRMIWDIAIAKPPVIRQTIQLGNTFDLFIAQIGGRSGIPRNSMTKLISLHWITVPFSHDWHTLRGPAPVWAATLPYPSTTSPTYLDRWHLQRRAQRYRWRWYDLTVSVVVSDHAGRCYRPNLATVRWWNGSRCSQHSYTQNHFLNGVWRLYSSPKCRLQPLFSIQALKTHVPRCSCPSFPMARCEVDVLWVECYGCRESKTMLAMGTAVPQSFYTPRWFCCYTDAWRVSLFDLDR
jgi:hypothetical protein